MFLISSFFVNFYSKVSDVLASEPFPNPAEPEPKWSGPSDRFPGGSVNLSLGAWKQHLCCLHSRISISRPTFRILCPRFQAQAPKTLLSVAGINRQHYLLSSDIGVW